jgi:hypothetical protein
MATTTRVGARNARPGPAHRLTQYPQTTYVVGIPRPYVVLSIVAVIVVYLAILKTQFVSTPESQLRSDALPTLLGPSRLRGELIDQLVHRVPRVALHPPERDATLPHDLD